MPRNGPTKEKPMKYLTPIYLTLMHAFRSHADAVLAKEHTKYLDRICIMQEYCTLRVDAGRQTGKSEAVTQFCKDWMAEGNDVIVISGNVSQSMELSKRIQRAYKDVFRIGKDTQRKIIASTKRTFLSQDDTQFDGIILQRPLIIIDEPIRIIEMYRYYKSCEDKVKTNSSEMPLFFVIGMQ
ncbi:hypothetical protein KNT87_gp112 [Erwinia phage Cronus]|uniref:Uncharacterized protein n=1 Tax=Erwinia phage Cronus TaxID=2163633 RepID=A0A2S1GMD4_9CAUD|nr:hypothetical protein KNT87_gp112 [Erwinia phage Cronus]AWD90551.1 hypothetical protein [Erwinia phage Cronus]